jgi:hypothetical protein
MNEHGEQMWQARIGTTGDDEAASATSLRSGEIVVGGTTNELGPGGIDMWIATMGTDGRDLDSCPIITRETAELIESDARLEDLRMSYSMLDLGSEVFYPTTSEIEWSERQHCPVD